MSTRLYIRKIRNTDKGWGTPSSAVWPWLVVDERGKGRAFRTWRLALRYWLKRRV